MSIFEKNIITIYKDKGEEWLVDLPKIVDEVSANWGLSELKPLNNLSYHYVLSGLKNDHPIILKLGLDLDGLKREATALSAFVGFGAVKVLAQQDGALLLERAVPGVSLKSYFPQRESEATQIACNVMKKLHQASVPGEALFPHIRDWLLALDKEWDIPAHHLEKARKLRDQLIATSAEQVLLHGDLHHDNILLQSHPESVSRSHENNLKRVPHDPVWLVIDPKGVIGYPVNEVWAFIGNPTPKLSLDTVLNRVQLFSKRLNLNSQLIIDWCFVQSVLSWTWDLEDNQEPSSICLTEIFEKKSNL